MPVQTVPLQRPNVGNLPPARRSPGDEIGLAQQQLALASRGDTQDRELRELALLLGAQQTQESLALTRGQLGEQQRQFDLQLKASKEENRAERLAAQNRLETQLEGQMDEVTARLDAQRDFLKVEKRQRGLTEQRIDLQAAMNNFAQLGNSAVSLGLLRGQEEVGAIHNSMTRVKTQLETRNDSVKFFVQRLQAEGDLTQQDIEQLFDDTRGMINELTNTIQDSGLSADQRSGAAFFLGSQDAANQNFTPFQVLRLMILELRGVASGRQKRQLDVLVDEIAEVENRLAPSASSVITEFQDSLVPLTSRVGLEEKRLSELGKLERERGVLVGEQDPALRFGQRDQFEFSTARGDVGGQASALQQFSSLAEQLSATQGAPIQPPETDEERRRRLQTTNPLGKF